MAKSTTCPFCGKEITTGFFSGDASDLSIGTYSTDCCEDCKKIYKPIAKSEKNRFSAKLDNYKKATKRRPTKLEIGQFFKKYCDEMEAQAAKTGGIVPQFADHTVSFAPGGYFSVLECSSAFSKKDITAREMIRTGEKALRDTGCLCFDKDDVTMLEYAPSGIGDSLGLFKWAYSYEIRFNDPAVVTYRPCVTRIPAIGKGIFSRRNAEKGVVKFLQEMRAALGTNVPIRKGKRA